MTSCQEETDLKERRLLSRYGKLPAKGDLLHHQLEKRKYFDSGDFALSRANTTSDIGNIHTGRENPLREDISHPASPVPGTSNVNSTANRQQQGEKSTSRVKEGSRLHEEVNENTVEYSGSLGGLKPLDVGKEEGKVGVCRESRLRKELGLTMDET